MSCAATLVCCLRQVAKIAELESRRSLRLFLFVSSSHRMVCFVCAKLQHEGLEKPKVHAGLRRPGCNVVLPSKAP